VLRFATWAAWLFRSPHEEQQYADELLSLSDEHGFPLWAGWAMVHRGSALAERENLKICDMGHSYQCRAVSGLEWRKGFTTFDCLGIRY
jgi:hypothetical protein